MATVPKKTDGPLGPSKKKFTCATCKRHFATRSALQQHLKDKPEHRTGKSPGVKTKCTKTYDPQLYRKGNQKSLSSAAIKKLVQVEVSKAQNAAPEKGATVSSSSEGEVIPTSGIEGPKKFKQAFPAIHAARSDDSDSAELLTLGLLDMDTMPLHDKENRDHYLQYGQDPWTRKGKLFIVAEFYGHPLSAVLEDGKNIFVSNHHITPKDLWAALYTKYNDPVKAAVNFIPICPGTTCFAKFEEVARLYTQYRPKSLTIEVTHVGGKDAAGATIIAFTDNWRNAPFYREKKGNIGKDEYQEVEDLPFVKIIPASSSETHKINIPVPTNWKFTSGEDPDDYLSGVLYIYYKSQDDKKRPIIKARPNFEFSGLAIIEKTLSLSTSATNTWTDQEGKVVKYVPNYGTLQQFDYMGDGKNWTTMKKDWDDAGVRYTIEHEHKGEASSTWQQASGFIMTNIANLAIKAASTTIHSAYMNFHGQRFRR